MKNTLIAACIFSAASTCHAESAQSWRFLVGFDWGSGGDELVAVTYTDGAEQIIKAGGGFQMKAGVGYQVAPRTELIATLGYHIDDTNGNNGSIGFSRWPIEVLGMWRATESIRLGGGLRYASQAKISSSGAASMLGSADIESKPGLVVTAEYLIDKKVGLNLRLVNETFQYKGSSIKGDHVAVGLNVYF